MMLALERPAQHAGVIRSLITMNAGSVSAGGVELFWLWTLLLLLESKGRAKGGQREGKAKEDLTKIKENKNCS